MEQSASKSVKTTFREEDIEWLRKKYRTATSDPERIRMALNDAKRFNEILEEADLREI